MPINEPAGRGAELNDHIAVAGIKGFAKRFDALANIHGIADDGVVDTIRRTNILDDDRTGIQADTNPDRFGSRRRAGPIVLCDGAGNRQSGAAGHDGVIILLLGVPQNAISASPIYLPTVSPSALMHSAISSK